MDDEPVPSYDDITWESLPNDFRGLPRLGRRGHPARRRRVPGAPPCAGENWEAAWGLTPVKPYR